jgi:hypothetical protein
MVKNDSSNANGFWLDLLRHLSLCNVSLQSWKSDYVTPFQAEKLCSLKLDNCDYASSFLLDTETLVNLRFFEAVYDVYDYNIGTLEYFLTSFSGLEDLLLSLPDDCPFGVNVAPHAATPKRLAYHYAGTRGGGDKVFPLSFPLPSVLASLPSLEGLSFWMMPSHVVG